MRNKAELEKGIAFNKLCDLLMRLNVFVRVTLIDVDDPTRTKSWCLNK